MENDKKNLIIQVALKLFTTQGLYETPTSQIAKEAKIGTGTLFWYFPTKEDLIDKIYVQCVNSVIDSILPGLDREASIKHKLCYICITYITWSINNVDRFLYIRQYVNSKYKKNSLKLDAFEKSLNFEIFEEGKNQNIINDIPTSLLMDIWVAILNGITEHIIENKDKIDYEEYLKIAQEAAWNSIKK